MIRDFFRVLIVDLVTGRGAVAILEGRDTVAGGSGLAAFLFNKYSHPDRPWNDPDQPLIFAIGPLTGYFPLMSKTVCAFKSPYHDQYAESHGGGRSALSLRFADLDALVITGKATKPSCVNVGSRHLEIRDVSYLWGKDVFETGKMLRGLFKGAGHRSNLRIGPAGEKGIAIAGINVDTYRHFGRLGCGAVMGSKNLKAIVINGDAVFPLPDSKDYSKLFQEVYAKLTDTDMMSKYHDIGTPINMALLNELKMLPIRNLQRTSDPVISNITGEQFAENTLLRNSACAGCPVGCIHIGFVRERFQKEHRYLYRQVSYDHEPIFAVGSMLSVDNSFAVLAIIDIAEKMGLDVMSAGVALAWATEATEKGILSEKETIVPLSFGYSEGYKKAMEFLGEGSNEFYRLLGQGTLKAAEHFGGKDYACVLGQEMAGYATGEVFFTSQALGLRHSHLDSGGYAYDQKEKGQDLTKAVDFLVKDEQGRVLLTSMVACLFARNVYTDELLAKCLKTIGFGTLADNLGTVSRNIQQLRWQSRFACGFRPEDITIPRRFYEIETLKGPVDPAFFDLLIQEYVKAIRQLAGTDKAE
ncbi:aldehyde:ferredoxin oxidoreductase [Syntrophus gentianae]|uniref:Aldehyde:ferredoxin oxidoreductase n=1 Tax=Syntrophus gentianae TaxID=43775 RepID=A0A1H7VY85_9BACT|nr:aldehyde ferredoxin oxidoreductase N-terminal domain-containing protein [Syntrophus gentianae]SEM14170.1 aldehyde:ferredoxin oxidoreductase [Syntrophus gentianae]